MSYYPNPLILIRETMLNHTRREHPDILFSCNVCHKDFFNKTELEKHQVHTSFGFNFIFNAFLKVV